MMDSITPGLWDISTAIARGDAVFFVGAGLSVSAGSPTWNELAEILAQQLSPCTQEKTPQLVAQFFRNQHGDHRLHSVLRTALNRTALQPTAVHRRMCKLPVNVFVTTNYDCLLEDTLRAIGRPLHVITEDNDLALWDEKSEVQVMKIHGDLDKPNSIVFTEEDYARFLHGNLITKRKLLDFFSYHTVIFLGYSMRDPDIQLIYAQVVHELGRLKRPAYLLTLEELDVHMEREWKRRSVIPIVVPMLARQTKEEALLEVFKEIETQLDALMSPARCDVLIVDDQVIWLEICRLLLSQEFPSLRIETATDGYEASLCLGKLRPRVVLVDLFMPRMDGFELIRLIRKQPDLEDTKIVVVSGFAAESHPSLKTANVDAIYQKPVSPKALRAIIAGLLSIPSMKAPLS